MSTTDRLRQLQSLAEYAGNKMAKNPEVLSLLLAFSLLFFSNQFGKNGGVVQSPKLPTPLFAAESPITDFHLGDLQAALEYIKQAETEIWMVMYYAHWDATSLETAQEYDRLSKAFRQVTFVAVNCWWPYGSCKSKVKPPRYPVIVGHVLGREGVQYTGIKRYNEMRAFIHKLRVPYSYIQTQHDILALRALEDTIVIAYFNFSATLSPRGLDSFHQAALSSLEKDPIQPTPFAVVTNVGLAMRLGLNQSKSLVLLRNFNYTIKFPLSERFKAANILSFVYGDSREQYTGWISPTGVKSTILATQIMSGPALVLFTNYREETGFHNNYYMLREVMLQYSRCRGNTTLLDEVISYIQQRRLPTPHIDGDSCVPPIPPPAEGSKPCCQSLASLDSFEVIRAKGNFCHICEQSSRSLYSHSLDYCSVTAGKSCHSLWPLFGSQVLGVPNSCNHLNNFYNPYSVCQLCCSRENTPHIPADNMDNIYMHTAGHGVTSSAVVLNRECIYCDSKSGRHPENYGHKYSSEELPDASCRQSYSDGQAEVLNEFMGLLCRANRSVNFFAVRKKYFSILAERLGVDKKIAQGVQDIAVIIDEQNEEYFFHPLDEDVTEHSLRTFIINFTNGELRRNLTSVDPTPRPADSCKTSSHTGCIIEVTADTFRDIVLDDSKDVLLLYYAHWCGACKRIAHMYLTLAQLFETSPNILIARINGDQNDLPWEFVPVSYPMIIMYPARHKANSIIYPRNQPITITHLVRFMIQHSS